VSGELHCTVCSALTLLYGFLGYFMTDDTGVIVVFRKPPVVPPALTA
jgi:hypothetical protein